MKLTDLLKAKLLKINYRKRKLKEQIQKNKSKIKTINYITLSKDSQDYKTKQPNQQMKMIDKKKLLRRKNKIHTN